jgi:hypothetical protein
MKSFRLKLRREDGPIWRQLLIGLVRGVAIYLAIGIALALIFRIVGGPEAWMDFYAQQNLAFALQLWAVGWPFLLFVWIVRGRH